MISREYSNMNENHKIFYHKMGTAQEEDVLIYENPKYPQRFYTASTDEDETVMFISEDGFGAGNNLMMKDLRRPNAPVVAITTDADFIYSPIEVMGNNIYVYTNYKAPKYRLMKANIDNPRIENWTEVIPEGGLWFFRPYGPYSVMSMRSINCPPTDACLRLP